MLTRRGEPVDLLLALRVAFWIAAVTALVGTMKLPRALALLTPRRPRRRGAPSEASTRAGLVTRYANALLRWRVFGGRPICWKRALVVYRMLRGEGEPVQLVIGVRKDDAAALHAHAWVSLEGIPLGEERAPEFRVVLVYPPPVTP